MKSKGYGGSLGGAAHELLPASAAGINAAGHKPAPRNPEVNNFDGEGNTQLHNSSYNGNTKRIQKLFDDNADINIATRNQYQDSPLHKAVAGGYIEAIQLLIDLRAEVNQRNRTDQTPGHYAAYHCNSSIIAALLEAKANPMAREDEYGDDWLHKVASSDKANNATKREIFVLLKNCEVTMVQNDDHKTAIDYAYNNPELIGMLKEVFGDS